jgi:hypothetical protein
MTRVNGRPGRGAKLYMGCLLALVLTVVAVLVFLAPAWWPSAH